MPVILTEGNERPWLMDQTKAYLNLGLVTVGGNLLEIIKVSFRIKVLGKGIGFNIILTIEVIFTMKDRAHSRKSQWILRKTQMIHV